MIIVVKIKAKKAMKEFQVNNPDKKVAIVVTTTNHLGLSDRNIYSLFDLFYLGIVTDNGYLSKADMSKLYAGSDVLIVASLAENMPNVIIEAQGFGVPVISTNAGGAYETIIDGETGHIVESHDPNDLSERIISVLIVSKSEIGFISVLT